MLIAKRERLLDDRESITHEATIYSHEYGEIDCYVTVGLYDDGRPGEVFVRIAKQGSTVSSLVDQWAIAVSIALQSGVPLSTITGKFKHTKFEPSGMTKNSEIPMCSSPLDYISRWLERRFDSSESTEEEKKGVFEDINESMKRKLSPLSDVDAVRLERAIDVSTTRVEL